VTVAADPRAASVPTQEAQLSKAALLYGDRVTVLSPVTAMLLRASELSRVGVKRQVEVLQTIAPLLTSGPKTADLQRGLALTAASLGKVPQARNSTDLIMRQTLLENLGSTINILTTIAEHSLQERGVGEFTPVRARGLLEFESGASGNDLELLGACLAQAVLASEGLRLHESDETRLLDAFAARLSRHLASGRDWLLLDESVASLVTSDWGGPLALWGWLPTFPQATLDELLLIRSRLSAPIERLHRALGAILENLSDQHSGPVSNELHEAWRETLQPAIETIATTVRDDYALRSISASVPGAAGESRLGLALVGPATAGHDPAARLAGDKPGATTVALAAALQRHLPDHEVRLPPFFSLYRSSDSVSNVSD
jgi:hypothetical protein